MKKIMKLLNMISIGLLLCLSTIVEAQINQDEMQIVIKDKKGQNKKISCGKDIQWMCGKPFYFSTQHFCKSEKDKSKISYEISLNGSVIKQGNEKQNLKDKFTPSENGKYTINFQAICGKIKTKPCFINVVVSNCKPDPEKRCCAFSLNLINKLGNNNIYSKVKISAVNGSQIINTDPDNWNEIRNYPNSVTWSPSITSTIPFGESIDNDFVVYLSTIVNNQTLKVEWLDANNIVKATHEISIPCDKVFDEDEDWTKYVNSISSSDNNISVFAAKEDSEDDCGEEISLFRTNADCPFTSSIQCVGNVHTITVNGPAGFVYYNWKVNGTLNSNHGSSFSFPASSAGEQKIEMEAKDSNDDFCYYQDGIIIPNIDPEIIAIKDKCTLKYKFTASGWDDSDVASILWNSSSLIGFPNTGQGTKEVSYIFPSDGIYSVSIQITDIYGCTKTKSQSFDINNICTPLFEESYKFCPDDCKNGQNAKITVNFKNISSGGFCPINYTWDFGDGTSNIADNSLETKHVYEVNCKEGGTFNVSLTMVDSNPNISKKCLKIFTKTITVKQCKFDFSYEVCPDGRVNFKEINGEVGEWSFPGSQSIAPWPYSDLKKTKKGHSGLRNKVVVRYDNSGDYLVTLKGIKDDGCECEIFKTIHVELDCCRKNQAARDNSYFSLSGKNYKVKYKFAARQFPAFHKLISTTKLKEQKKIRNTSINYWRRSSANTISSSINGQLYRRDNATTCNCKIPQNLNANKSEFNKSKAKCKYDQVGKFRLRLGNTTSNRVQSTHEVILGSNIFTYHLELPNNNCLSNVFDNSKDCCTPFRWYFDWF